MRGARPWYSHAVLDWPHRLALDAARDGTAEPSPALDDLVATGLVVRDADRWELTDAGRAALAASTPSRVERWSWTVLAVCLVVLAIGVVVGWVAG
jgi:hypothetical protein